MKVGFFETHNKEQQEYYQQNLSGYGIEFFENPLTTDSSLTNYNLEIISIFTGSKLNQQVIDSFPNLKHIVVRATGFDNVDVEYAKSKNITVSNVPSYGANTVAEYTFGLILSLSRNIPQAVYRLKVSGEFSFEGFKGFDLNGKTLGVVGTGKIGANVIKIAKGFNMKVLAFDPHQNLELRKELEFDYVSLEDLLQNSDIVTLHVPLMEQTHHLINKDNIALMKKGSLLVNTSRGGIVDTDALAKALTLKQIKGAALDVLEEEGDLKEEAELLINNKIPEKEFKAITEDHILIHMPNVLITPHMAFYTKEAESSIRETTVNNIKACISDTPQNLV